MAAIRCLPPHLSEDEIEGVVHFSAWFSGGDKGYLIISAPAPVVPETSVADFYGKDHYVEVNDQGYGCYGGIEKIAISPDGCGLNLLLSDAVPDYGSAFELRFEQPLPSEARDLIARLSAAA